MSDHPAKTPEPDAAERNDDAEAPPVDSKRVEDEAAKLGDFA